MNFKKITVKPIAGAIGAEINGIDLAQDIDDQTIAEIAQAQRDHLVILFRDRDIKPAQHLAFANRFSDILEYQW